MYYIYLLIYPKQVIVFICYPIILMHTNRIHLTFFKFVKKKPYKYFFCKFIKFFFENSGVTLFYQLSQVADGKKSILRGRLSYISESCTLCLTSTVNDGSKIFQTVTHFYRIIFATGEKKPKTFHLRLHHVCTITIACKPKAHPQSL